jgi:hypothetical protein
MNRGNLKSVSTLLSTCLGFGLALTDVLIRDSSKTTCVNNLYVHCSVTGESILNEERRESLLRVLHFMKRGNWTHKYSTPYM